MNSLNSRNQQLEVRSWFHLLIVVLISFLLLAAFLTQTVALDDVTVKFEIWDTAGQGNLVFILSFPSYFVLREVS
jgi:sterol desaturase/sphingolipid hydroxylase (fatty acid hydroxylase superfamily)